MLSRLQTVVKKYFGVCNAGTAIPAINGWFTSAARGQALLQQQKAHIDESLSCLFGYHLCQLSVCPNTDLTKSSKIGHKFSLGPCVGNSVSALFDNGKLPLPPESMDVFLLHHALDFSQTPHQLLAEVARALVPRGHIVIVGFNPWSLLGLWRSIVRIVTRKPESRQELLPLKRLEDWLVLLDLKAINIEQGYHFPSKNPVGSLQGHLTFPFGGYYLVIARKDIEGVSPISPASGWKKVDIGGMPDSARSRL